MKKATAIIFLICLICLSNRVKSQSKDTLYIEAKVIKIDTISYYTVIKAISKKDAKQITILAPIDERNALTINKKNSNTVKIGDDYLFILVYTSKMKIGQARYSFIDLRRLYYKNVLILNEGELPYIALNMYKTEIYW